LIWGAGMTDILTDRTGAEATPCDMAAIFDVLCPMHLVLNKTGHIVHVGPTLEKIRDKGDWLGKRFLELFALKRPRSVNSAKELMGVAGSKLHLQLRDPPSTNLKGVLVPSCVDGQQIVNLSFGISAVEAVQVYDLTSTDFAPNDLTVEMLYLVEAKSAAMEASRKLNQRLQGAMIAVEEQAFTNIFTGLKNRRAFDVIIERHLETGSPFALMQIDLDFFKMVNDSHGHAGGDYVLQMVSRIMVAETRVTDTVARLGGDEFVILFPDLNDIAVLKRIGNRIISQLEYPILFQENVCRISASIGTVFKTSNRLATGKQLYEEAYLALYASKRAGRERQTFYHEGLMPSSGAESPPSLI
jgi:diguanylate cyclase (GGDEF)-like protein